MRIINKISYILIFIFLTYNCFANYDNNFCHTSFTILNNNKIVDKEKNVIHYLNKNINGFIFDVQYINNEFYTGTSKKVKLKTQFRMMNKYLNSNNKFLILILNNSFSGEKLDKLLKSSKLDSFVYNNSHNNEWYSLKQLSSLNKRLLIFHKDSLLSKSDYLIDFKKSGFETTKYNSSEHIASGNIVYDIHSVNFNIIKESEKPFQSLLSLWKTTGKKPTFVVCDSYSDEAVKLTQQLNNTYYIKGNINSKGKTLNNVSWIDLPMVSHGNFTYPLPNDREIEFIPEKSGYTFNPLRLKTEARSDPNLFFDATEHIDYNNSKTAYYNFNNDAGCNINPNNKGFNFGAAFVDDDLRKRVAGFSSRDFMTLPNTERYSIFGKNSISMSVWFKIRSYTESESNIFYFQKKQGSDFRAFLKDRYLSIIFWGDTLKTNFKANYKWHNISVTYNHNRGILSAYIDGKLLKTLNTSKNRIIKDNIILGKFGDSYLEGYLDNFRCWNRELSAKEVYQLHTSELIKPDFQTELISYYPLEGNSLNHHDKTRLKGTDFNIEYVNDGKFGKVASFNGKDSYIDCGNDSDYNITNVISVSAWIKPYKLKEHISIIGKGFSYSAKMFDKFMLFTTTFISDHYSDKPVLKENEWQHVCYVFNAGDTVRFYLNGKCVGAASASEIKPYKNSFLIGSNLWGQYYEGLMHQIVVWNRELQEDEIKFIYNNTSDGTNIFKKESTLPLKEILFTLFGFLLIVISLFLYIRIRKAGKWKKDSIKEVENSATIEETKNSLYLFGAFTVFDNNSENVTRKFTPRLRQLFLVILLNTLSKERGISTKKLTDIMWPGLSPQSAKNNRSTNVQNLRSILQEVEGIEIVFEDKLWRTKISDKFYCDYKDFIDFMREIESNTSSKALSNLLNILKRGELLPNQSFEWLDKYKNNTSDEVIDILTSILSDKVINKNKKVAYKVAKVLILFDPVNEDALHTIIRHYKNTGKQIIAKKVYDKYSREYKYLYDEDYKVEFKEIV